MGRELVVRLINKRAYTYEIRYYICTKFDENLPVDFQCPSTGYVVSFT
jgi:hypothetical protein